MDELDEKLKKLVMRHGWITEEDDWQQAISDIKQAFADEGGVFVRDGEGFMVDIPKRMTGQEFYDRFVRESGGIWDNRKKAITIYNEMIEAAKRAAGIKT